MQSFYIPRTRVFPEQRATVFIVKITSSTMSDSTMTAHDEEEAGITLSSSPPPTIKPAPSPPPNGGTTAWLQVACGFSLFFNSWGILNTFGVYQTYYESGVVFEASSSQISWIGSVTAFLLLLTGLFAGPLFDRGYLRLLLILGSFLIVFGQMMLSISDRYYQLFLAQGVAIGIGTGCLFVPCIAILPQWFSTRLGAALGIAVSGSALGGVIYPIVLYGLIDQVGFPWAVRSVGFIALGTLLLPITFMRQRVIPPKARALLDMSAFTDLTFLSFVMATFVNYMGLFVIIFYLSYYSEARKFTDGSLSFYLVAIFNAGSVIGRTVPNFIADKTGPFNLLAPAAVVSGIIILCMPAVTSNAGIIAMAVVSGTMSGALIGLPPLCLVALAKVENKLPLLGTRMGMGYAIIALGVLASGPSAGAILGGGRDFAWTGLWTFGGASTTFSGFLYFLIRVWKYGPKPGVKA